MDYDKFATRLTELSSYTVLPYQVERWHKTQNPLDPSLAEKIAQHWNEQDPLEGIDPFGLFDCQSYGQEKPSKQLVAEEQSLLPLFV
jgi:hypothetical protein